MIYSFEQTSYSQVKTAPLIETLSPGLFAVIKFPANFIGTVLEDVFEEITHGHDPLLHISAVESNNTLLIFAVTISLSSPLAELNPVDFNVKLQIASPSKGALKARPGSQTAFVP